MMMFFSFVFALYFNSCCLSFYRDTICNSPVFLYTKDLTKCICICVFLNRKGHSYITNQASHTMIDCQKGTGNKMKCYFNATTVFVAATKYLFLVYNFCVF